MPKTSKVKWKDGDMNDKKKLAIVREYRKMMKSRKDGSVQNSLPKTHSNQQFARPKKKKMSSIKRAMVEYQNKQNEKEKKKEARELARKEREEAVKKRKEHYKRLSKKTKWGQPIMKNRVEILLEKLQKQTNTSEKNGLKYCFFNSCGS